MKISQLIVKLEEIKNKEGDLNVCISESHDYWGSIQSHLTDYNMDINQAQPDGPKSGKSEKSLIFKYE